MLFLGFIHYTMDLEYWKKFDQMEIHLLNEEHEEAL
jgi:hypothetical protein